MVHQYYKFNYDKIDNSQTVESDASQIRKLVRESVDAHMVADVEVGSFLSSGVDSSYVFNEATKIKKQHIQSFTLGYDRSKYSEIDWAHDFAEGIGQKNTPIKIDADDYFVHYRNHRLLSEQKENDGRGFRPQTICFGD